MCSLLLLLPAPYLLLPIPRFKVPHKGDEGKYCPEIGLDVFNEYKGNHPCDLTQTEISAQVGVISSRLSEYTKKLGHAERYLAKVQLPLLGPEERFSETSIEFYTRNCVIVALRVIASKVFALGAKETPTDEQIKTLITRIIITKMIAARGTDSANLNANKKALWRLRFPLGATFDPSITPPFGIFHFLSLSFVPVLTTSFVSSGHPGLYLLARARCSTG